MFYFIIVGEKKVPVVMVGNKTDLEKWLVPTDIAFRSAAFDLNCSFVETSAKRNINVDSAFEILLPNYSETAMVDKNSENNKTCLFKRPFRRHSSANVLKVKPRFKKFSSLDYGRGQCNTQCTIL